MSKVLFRGRLFTGIAMFLKQVLGTRLNSSDSFASLKKRKATRIALRRQRPPSGWRKTRPRDEAFAKSKKEKNGGVFLQPLAIGANIVAF